MRFRTEVENPKYDFKLNYYDKIFTIGSCFAENAADYLLKRKINILANPLGVLYNPISIENGIKLLAGKIQISEDDLIYNQYEWHSFYHHSDFSSHEKDLLIEGINKNKNEAISHLSNSELVVITLGTSFIYKYLRTGKIVSNCHKIPQKEFEKKRLTISETVASLKNIVELLNEINPNTKIIFTVSPVRHWKDGAEENQRSKSILILSIDEIIKNKKNCFYYPSYEMMIDDLRDYRFYKDDLLHPTDFAVEYISNKFIDSIFNDEAKVFMKEAFQIWTSLNHKVRNRESTAYKKFTESLKIRIEEISKKFPKANFDDELYKTR